MRRLVVAFGAGLLVLAALSPRITAAEGVRLLYPPNRSLLTGPTRLIIAAPKADAAPATTLDGQPLALRRMEFAPTWQLPGKLKATAKLVGDRAATTLWTATLDLKPGGHAVVVGGQTLDVWGKGESAAPAAYTLLHSHGLMGEDAAQPDCGGCHEQPEGALASSPTPKACAGCHDEDTVQLVHQHVAPPLARCASCHDPHGSTRAKLLVDTKEALCVRCHEAGHSKQ